MINAIASNLGTLVVAVIVIAIISLIIINKVRDKKKGKSSCSCGCSGCPMNGQCKSNSFTKENS